jgi:hypothetical protein
MTLSNIGIFMINIPLYKNLTLHLDNFLFSSFKNHLFKVWLKLACWFCRKQFLQYKYGFSYCGPSQHQGPWYEQTWIYILSESFHVNKNSFGLAIFENNIFKLTHPIFAFWWLFLLWRELCHYFVKFWIPFSQGWFVPSLILNWRAGSVEVFFLIQTHVSVVFPIVAGDHDFNKLEYTLFQKALMKIWALLAHWFLRRFLNDPTPILYFCNYLSFEDEFTLPKDNSYLVWLNLASWFWRRF